MAEPVLPDDLDARSLAAFAADAGPDLLVVVDPGGVLRYGSHAAERMLGLDAEAEVGTSLLEWVHPVDVEAAIGAVNEASRRTGYHMPVEIRVRDAHGDWVRCEVNGTTAEGPGGAWLLLALRATAGRSIVADRREELQRLVQRASLECARLRWYQVDEVVEHFLGQIAGVVSASRIELAWHEDADGLTIGACWSADPARTPDLRIGAPFASMWPDGEGGDPLLRFSDDLAALAPTPSRDELVAAGYRSVVEVPLPSERRAVLRLAFDDDARTWDDTNTDVVCLAASILKSTLRRSLVEEQLHERARRDPMTGLLNRNELYGELAQLLRSVGPDGPTIGVLYGDLDRFKDVNDRFGHAEGDRLVLGVAGALVANVREGDLVARFGGDEFVVVCPDVEDGRQLDEIAERVEVAVRRLAPAGTSVGISFGRMLARPGQDADDVLRGADEAMYRAKWDRRRRLTSTWFEPGG